MRGNIIIFINIKNRQIVERERGRRRERKDGERGIERKAEWERAIEKVGERGG